MRKLYPALALCTILLCQHAAIAQKKGSTTSKKTSTKNSGKTSTPAKNTSTTPTPAVDPNAAVNKVVNDLASKIKVDPKNPLQINSQTLQDIAMKLPDGNLKYKLLDYSTRLNVDNGLGVRQVYWDLNHTFGTQTTNPQFAQFMETRASLDVLFNKSGMLVKALKGDVKGISATTFMSDPQFMYALTNLTGNSNTAMSLAAGLGAGVEIFNAIKEQKKWKEDYKKLSELSNMMIYPEADENLAKGLIDAYVGRAYSATGIIYRYEFKDGNSLTVEKGILKWVNKDNTGKKPLCKVAPATEGNTKQVNESAFPNIYIDPAEKYFLISWTWNAKEFKCEECLIKSNGMSYLVEVATGKIVTDYFMATSLSPEFHENYMDVWGASTNTTYGKYRWAYKEQKRATDLKQRVEVNKNAKFAFGSKEVKWKRADENAYLTDIPKFNISLVIGSTKMLTNWGDLLSSVKDTKSSFGGALTSRSADKRDEVYYTSSFLQLTPVTEIKPEDTTSAKKTTAKKDSKKKDDKNVSAKDEQPPVAAEIETEVAQNNSTAIAVKPVDTTMLAKQQTIEGKDDGKKGSKSDVSKKNAKAPAKKTNVKEKKPAAPPDPEARFVNEISALARDRSGKLYITGANGTLFSVDGNSITKEEELYSKVKDGLKQPAVVGTYDFAEPQTTRMFDANAATPFYAFPRLTLTPDEKVLVYTIKDQLYIAEASNLSNVKKFSLTFKPTDYYFGRENNGYTLYLRGENEFTFPITKKYSIDALVNSYDPNANVFVAPKNGGTNGQAAQQSVADEITKLKKLMDDGIISKDEFDQGKKKILGGN